MESGCIDPVAPSDSQASTVKTGCREPLVCVFPQCVNVLRCRIVQCGEESHLMLHLSSRLRSCHMLDLLSRSRNCHMLDLSTVFCGIGGREPLVSVFPQCVHVLRCKISNVVGKVIICNKNVNLSSGGVA